MKCIYYFNFEFKSLLLWCPSFDFYSVLPFWLFYVLINMDLKKTKQISHIYWPKRNFYIGIIKQNMLYLHLKGVWQIPGAVCSFLCSNFQQADVKHPFRECHIIDVGVVVHCARSCLAIISNAQTLNKADTGSPLPVSCINIHWTVLGHKTK